MNKTYMIVLHFTKLVYGAIFMGRYFDMLGLGATASQAFQS